MNCNKLKIGIDYHGVIDHRPDYFAIFCQEAMRRGHQIHIITGGPKTKVAQQLHANKIAYNNLFAIVDFYIPENKISQFTDEDYHIADNLWNRAKGDYCLKHDIDIHIDDSREYIKWFSTPYCLYDNINHFCILNKDKIDFTYPVSQTLDKIEKIFI